MTPACVFAADFLPGRREYSPSAPARVISLAAPVFLDQPSGREA
jgi:hypothetical protein